MTFSPVALFRADVGKTSAPAFFPVMTCSGEVENPGFRLVLRIAEYEPSRTGRNRLFGEPGRH
ncbi:MAG: hypothetical protein DBY37_11480 [Desulfovibrionaceae bacterium]|nr:MAG: hypothetical protein DBY37_11480 [Desulfovibrionaceae bacterium]